MIKIVKGNDERIVSKGAYENLYKSLGFELVVEKQPAKKVEVKKEEKKVEVAPAAPVVKNDLRDKE